jgi:hypothetical protein
MHSSEGGEDGSPSRPLSSAMASWPTGSFMERHSRIDSGKCQVDGTDEREPPSPSVTRRVHCPAARMVQQPGITVAAPTQQPVRATPALDSVGPTKHVAHNRPAGLLAFRTLALYPVALEYLERTRLVLQEQPGFDEVG